MPKKREPEDVSNPCSALLLRRIRFQTATYLVIFQLKAFTMLQALDLAPSWPLLPKMSSLIPFTSTSCIQVPPRPMQWTSSSSIEFATSIMLSPLVLQLAIDYTQAIVFKRLVEYGQLVFPRPDNPDNYSIKAARAGDLDDSTVPGLGFWSEPNASNVARQGSVVKAIRTDIQGEFNRVIATIKKWKRWSKTSMLSLFSHKNDSAVPYTILEGKNPRPHTPTAISTPLFEDHFTRSPSRNIGLETDLQPDTDTGSSTTTSSPQLSATDDEDMIPVEAENSMVHVTTRAGSTDTLHMNVGINGTTPEGPTYTSSFSAHPAPNVVETITTEEVDGNPMCSPINKCQTNDEVEPRHRVTTLSAHAAEAMNWHVTSDITDVLLIPLESLFLRSLALHALEAASGTSRRTQAAASRLRGEVYPMGSWFGLGRSGGSERMANYAGSMISCTALRSVVEFGVWQIGIGVAWWLGRTKFRWGRL